MKQYTESLIFIVITAALLLYVSIQQLELSRQEVISIILIIVFLVMAYCFAQLATGREDGDKQMIADLQGENDPLSIKNEELNKKIERLETDRAQRIRDNYKLGGPSAVKHLQEVAMIGKKIDFRILSNIRCRIPGCHKRLKQNLLNRNPEADLCYFHWVMEKMPWNAGKRLHLIKKQNPARDGALETSQIINN